jgi:hypothetical protein
VYAGFGQAGLRHWLSGEQDLDDLLGGSIKG